MKNTLAEELAKDPDFIICAQSFANTASVHRDFADYSYETVRRARHIVLKGNDPVYAPEEDFEANTDEFLDGGNTRNIVIPKTEKCTLDEFVAKHKIDTTIWYNDSFKVKEWEQGAKNNDGKLIKQQLCSISASFKRNKEAVKTKAIFEDLLADCKKHSPKPVKPFTFHKTNKSGFLHEICPFDLHLGKLCWGEEVGTDYDSEIASDLLRQAIHSLSEDAAGFSPERILFPVGNDFFNIDGSSNATEAGTLQDNDSRWKKMFRLGRELMVEVIDELTAIAPVDVLVVPGNHDANSAWQLGEQLMCWYHNNKAVNINNDPQQRKYYMWGTSQIGFTHGNKEGVKKLPIIMANDAPRYSDYKYHEMHIGHRHKEEVFDESGVIVRTIPSLSPPDDWHSGKGYASQRAAQSFLWHKERGRKAIFNFTPS